MLIIGIKLEEIAEFILIGNIIYINLTKCKRVTYVMFALELYVIIIRVDILIMLLSIIDIIINKFEIK